MTSSAFKWSERSLSKLLQLAGRNRRTHETDIRPVFSSTRSFFTALDANSFDHANLDHLMITSKFSERNSTIQDTPAGFRRDGLHSMETAVRKQRSGVSASTDLAELLGCEPHQIPSNNMQGYGTRRTEQNSTVGAAPLCSSDAIAHNVIFE